jgi:hypothetical protein
MEKKRVGVRKKGKEDENPFQKRKWQCFLCPGYRLLVIRRERDGHTKRQRLCEDRATDVYKRGQSI